MEAKESHKKRFENDQTRARVDTPEILDGKSWEVDIKVSAVPYIDMVNRKVVLPPGTSELARSIVRHEMGHGLWSPTKPKGGMYKSVHLHLEDAIINKRWEHLNRPVVGDKELLESWNTDLEKQYATDKPMALLSAIAGLGWQDPEGGTLKLDCLSPEDRSFVQKIEKEVGEYVSTSISRDQAPRDAMVKTVVEYLKLKDKQENKPPPPKPQSSGNNVHGNISVKIHVGPDGRPVNEEEIRKAQQEAKTQGDASSKPKKNRKRSTDTLKNSLKKSLSNDYYRQADISQRVLTEHREYEKFVGKRRAAKAAKAAKLTRFSPVDASKVVSTFDPGSLVGAPPRFDERGENGHLHASWGHAEIATPRLTEKDVSTRFLGRRYAPTDEGVIIKYPDREFTDGKIYGIKNTNKRGGGSIMLDWSGSMSLSSERVFELIKMCPRRTKVACYSGTGDKGRIILCADKGRYIDEETLTYLRLGGGNVIDGPAVAWLALNAKPRIWISDGRAFGVLRGHEGIVSQARIINELHDTMVKYNIIRCQDVEMAKMVLDGTIPKDDPMFEDTVVHTSIGRTSEATVRYRQLYMREHTKRNRDARNDF